MNTITRKVDKPCERCGSYVMEFREKGPHIGQYCKCCFKFIKWVPKTEAPIELQNAIKKREEKERLAKVYNDTLEFESWLKMVTEIVEAKDNGQNA